MSDLDSMTNEEVAKDLEKLNIDLSRKGQLHAYEDAVMIQAFKRLRENPTKLLAPKKQFQHNETDFTEPEFEELRRQFKGIYFRHKFDHDEQLRDFAEHPVQLSLYKKIGLFSELFKCEEYVGNPGGDGLGGYCGNDAEWVTNPHNEVAQALFDKIGNDAGLDDTWCEDGEKAISAYFGEHLIDVITPQFRCEKHIKKLKEIAIKI